MKELSDQAQQLSQLLGDDHDLTVLHEQVVIAREAFAGQATVEPLPALIERRRRELQREAFPVAMRVYGDKPNRFIRRIRGYWKLRMRKNPPGM